MLASKLADTALVLGSVAALVVAAAVLVLVWRRGLGKFALELPGLKATVAAIDTKVDQINTAVNHQPEGESTLVQRVQLIERDSKAHRRWEAEVMALIGAQLGIEIPPPPQEDAA